MLFKFLLRLVNQIKYGFINIHLLTAVYGEDTFLHSHGAYTGDGGWWKINTLTKKR